MALTLRGPVDWSMQRDSQGHRTYTIRQYVESDSRLDGPANALRCPGLPLPGSPWLFFDDYDPWAICLWEAAVDPKEGEEQPFLHWIVEHTFSTKPVERGSCRDTEFEDPLLEPMRVSGSFTKYNEEAVLDRYGLPIRSSSWEQFRGQHVEFDWSRPTVRIEQNVPNLQMELVSSLMDHLNDGPMWGLSERMVKLSGFSWEKKFYGSCYSYYTRTFDFEINYRTFDRYLLDEGSKVLRGKWNSEGEWETIPVGRLLGVPIPPDPGNPRHFVRFKDRNGEVGRVLLDGAGMPALGDLTTGTADDQIGRRFLQKYDEGNLFALNLPTVL